MFRAPRVRDTFELRSRVLIQRPAFRTLLSGCGGRPVERPFAFATVEACEMSARKRGPDHTVEIEVDAARTVSFVRRQVNFRQRGLRRVWTLHETQDVAKLIHAREAHIHRLAPDRIIDRTRLNTVE